jgi:hypothetical protein
MATGQLAFCGDTAAVIHEAVLHRAQIPARHGVSPKTTMREWNTAKAWLYGVLKERQGDDTRRLEQGKGAL